MAQARDKLDKFERRTISRRVVDRLRHHRPFHPFFLLRGFSLFLASILGLGALAVMVVPMLDRDIAVMLSRLEDAAVLPVPVALGVLAASCLLFAFGAHLALLVAGRTAPLLPHEARQHQRLVSDVKRIEATMAVQARLTPAPADPRIHGYP
ncbi:MAG: hypothetical protein AAF602_08900 [Myxococcota bacterium]